MDYREQVQKSFALWIEHERRRRNWSLQELGEKIKIDRGTLSRIENKLVQTTLVTAIRLCVGLELNLRHLREIVSNSTHGEATTFEKIGRNGSALQVIPLSIEELNNYLEIFREDSAYAGSVLLDWFNDVEEMAAQSLGRSPSPLPEMSFDQLLTSSPLYRLQLRYPPQRTVETIRSIYTYGGALGPEDVELYISRFTDYSDLVHDLGRKEKSDLKRLQNGDIEQMKLADTMELDRLLHEDFLGLYWRAYRSIVGDWQAETIEKVEIRTEHEAKLVSLLVILCHWHMYLGGDSDAISQQLHRFGAYVS